MKHDMTDLDLDITFLLSKLLRSCLSIICLAFYLLLLYKTFQDKHTPSVTLTQFKTSNIVDLQAHVKYDHQIEDRKDVPESLCIEQL